MGRSETTILISEPKAVPAPFAFLTKVTSDKKQETKGTKTSADMQKFEYLKGAEWNSMPGRDITKF